MGSPALVVEILSPRTARKDLREKLLKYAQAGVPEYWVIFPTDKVVNVYKHDEQGRYGAPTVYVAGEQVPVGVLPGLVIDLERVFAE